jgi:hypothetical protein
MRNDSLQKLESSFNTWRRRKEHIRERVPERLMERVRSAIEVHGEGPVANAIKFQRSRLPKRLKGAGTVPSYTRIEVPFSQGPLAEAETPSGVKLRVFSVTPEVVGLLSVLSGVGVAQ